MTGRQLRAWRLAQRHPDTMRPWTQKTAGLWYGLAASSADRTWRRWESGEVPVPRPLARRIEILNGRPTWTPEVTTARV